MNVDLAVNRMFGLFGIPRDEVVFEIKPLPATLGGYWTDPGNSDHPVMVSLSDEKATIVINSSYISDGDWERFLQVVAHELQHHSQWRDCRMYEFSYLSDRKKYKIWDGEIHTTGDKPYHLYYRDPWEVEARAAESLMLARYNATYGEILVEGAA